MEQNRPLIAVITGGTRGIGKAIAERLVKDGAEVTITGTKALTTPIETMSYEAIDFTDETALKVFAGKIRDIAPDILINNAGINKITPFADIDPADFCRIQQVNIEAAFTLCQSVLPAMKRRRWGRIVNISSIWGKIGKKHRAAYSTSKFALDGMTVALAAEVASEGILVNCVAPGIIDTELTHQILGDNGILELKQQIPLGRLGRPEEIATLVCWLASSENSYISGQNISIDGGLSRV